MEARRAGMTLLEVLAAVMVLGLLYTALAGAAMQGLRAEGESQRRLEASLLADRAMADIEAALESGGSPPRSAGEQEQDGFLVRLAVTPLELPLPAAEGPFADVDDPGPSLLVPERAGAPSPLVRIDLEVAWVEGAGERSVHRTTIAFDRSTVSAALEALDAATGSAPEGGAATPTSAPASADAEPRAPSVRDTIDALRSGQNLGLGYVVP